ncbi:MAG: DUF3604 domain-containing protein [Deltaproteobacteria bacterium]|nr:DUF3604 domain-containing protein [Deltaproteobacteria bacterium]MBW2395822.1 DUF3604 domain-containing protein [Deltaproteobacteria bacterium]
MKRSWLAIGLVALAWSNTAVASDSTVPTNPLREAYFGETHVHTAYSLDAYLGGTRLTPDDAYRFAKGEEVTILGRKHRIGRALDFAAVTDHAEYLGEMYSTMNEGAPGHDQELLQELRGLTGFEEREAWFLKLIIGKRSGGPPQHTPFFAGPETVRSGWQVVLAAAEAHDDPGRFTTYDAVRNGLPLLEGVAATIQERAWSSPIWYAPK